MSMYSSTSDDAILIAIDHGYGNIKTPNFCFPAGFTVYDTKPPIASDILNYKGKYYDIGTGHLEFSHEKTDTTDYYVLTLVAVAKELETQGRCTANVHLAVGLPLARFSQQKDAFRDYLLKETAANFIYNDKWFSVRVKDVSVYPQGFAAVVPYMGSLKPYSMLCDIGNGTLDMLEIVHHKANNAHIFTTNLGTSQCLQAVRDALQNRFGKVLPDEMLEELLRTGHAPLLKDVLSEAKRHICAYVDEVFRFLREHGYDPDTYSLYVVGGGTCLMKQYNKLPDNVTIIDDIAANAKGYEYLFRMQKCKEGAKA